MILIVGAVIPQYPHYHNYFILTVMVNIAWLMGAIGVDERRRRVEPVPPRRSPPGFLTRRRGSGAPGTAGKAPAPPPTTTPTAFVTQMVDQPRLPRARDARPDHRLAPPGIFSPGGRTTGTPTGPSSTSTCSTPPR